MTALPWFPFYTGDYLRKTMHLTTQEHGAYLLILLSYYANASPPLVDDLPAIARLSPRDWVAIRPRIAKFFEEKDGKWHQKKADEILAESDSTHVARSQAGKKGNEVRWGSPGDRPAIPQRSQEQSPGDRISQPQPQLRKEGTPPINGNGLSNVDKVLLSKELERIEERIERVREGATHDACGVRLDPDEKAELKKLKARAEEIKTKLGFAA